MNRLAKTPTVLPAGSNTKSRADVSAAARMLGALLIASTLTACNDEDPNQNMQLVQGRKGCVDVLVNEGRPKSEAADICDKAFASAIADSASRGETVASSGNSNAYFWYWMGRNSNNQPVTPSVYRSTGSGFVYVGGNRTQGYTPPSSFSEEEATTFRTPPGIRAASSSSGGTSYTSSGEKGGGYSAESFGARSSAGIARGGFGGEGVSMGG